jgi:cardiolipin synthase
MAKNEKTTQNDSANRILTLPNLLSLIRLIMIPIIVWMYCALEEYFWTGILVIVSGVTDVVDGFIARKFGLVSDFGKALDPIADKMTQGAVLLCLVTRFNLMLIPLIILLIKEVVTGALRLFIAKKTHAVHGANWHGKITTVLLYAVIILHIFWANMPLNISNIMIAVSIAMMLFSFVMYSIQNFRLIKESKNNT